MAKAASRLGIVFVAGGIGVLAVFAIAWYDFVWVASQKRYFNERNFRVLKTLSTQIQSKLDGYDKIMENTLSSCDGKGSECKENLEKLSPDLKYLSEVARKEEPGSVDMRSTDDPPVLQISRDHGKLYLYLGLEGSNKDVIVTKTDVGKVIRPLIQPLLTDNLFDAVVLAQADGRVILQQGSSSLQFDRISSLFDKEKQTKKEPEEKEKKDRKEEKVDARINREALLQSSDFKEVNLEGTDYRLYLHPIQLSYYSYPHTRAKRNVATGSGPNTKETGTGNEYEEWVLCGLVQSSRFRSASLVISFNYILGVSLVVLLLLSSLPFLKLQLMNPRERLLARDGVFLVISTFFVTGLLTFLLLDLYYYAYEYHDRADEQLKTFAEAINCHFGKEEQKIWEQLDHFERSKGFEQAFGFIKDYGPKKQLKTTAPDGEIPCSKPRPPSAHKLFACYQPDLLSEKSRRWIGLNPPTPGQPGWSYPHFQNAIWYDKDGWQRIKWDLRNTPTRFLHLTKADNPYYRESTTQIRWWKPEEGQKSPPRGIHPRYSVNTGENIVVFWRLVGPQISTPVFVPLSSGKEPKDQSPLLAGFISTRPISLIQPVLPGHLEFAVIDKNGKVLFHSDSTLNMRENFLEECDLNGKLRSLIASGASDSLTANYRGRGHHLYVTRLNSPSSILEDGPWTIVAFRDMDIQETMNVELMTLSTYLFILYAGSLGVLWALTYLIWGKEYPKKWFWPNEHKGRAYRQVMVLNTTLLVVFFLLIQWLQRIDILCLAFLLMILLSIPLAFGILPEDRLPNGRQTSSWLDYIPDFFKGARQPRWRTAYFGARVSLLLLVVVLPCFTFFKISYNFEEKLLIERAQLNLANRLEERKQRVRKTYENIKLENEKDICREPDGDSPLWAYHQDFLKTTLYESHCDRKEFVQSPVESGLNWFFSRIRPLYNYVAEETHGLIADPDREDHETGVWETHWKNDEHEGWKPLLENKPPQTEVSDTARAQGPPWLVLRRHSKDKQNFDLAISSEWHPLEVPWGKPFWWLAWGVFLSVLYLLVRYGTGKVLMIDPYRPPSFKSTNLVDLFDKGIKDFPAYTLVVGPPNCGKTAQLNELRKLMTPQKLAQAVGQSQPILVSQSDPMMVLDLHEKGQTKDWAATFDSQNLPSDRAVPIAIDHFEYRADDPQSNEQKLLLLEKLVFMEKRKVLIVSTLNPTSCFSSGGPGDAWNVSVGEKKPQATRNVNRWESVLRSFSELDFKVVNTNGFAETVGKFEEKLLIPDYKMRPKLVDLFKTECTPTLRLREIGKELVDNLQAGVEMTPEELIDEIVIRTEAYYQALWATCSKSEKLLLVQLAQEGLVNPKNTGDIRQLMRKRLVAQDPAIRIMNESFRRFAASAIPPETITAMEREGVKMSWGNVKAVSLTIALGVAAFLFITQQALFEMWMAYATGLLAAIPAVVKLFGKREG